MKQLTLTMLGAAIIFAGCATTADEATLDASSTVDPNSPTAHDVMKTGGTYEYRKPTGAIYANSSAELAERYAGRHIDELPEAESSRKAVDNMNRVICKEVSRTHTRLRTKKVCATRKEWDEHKSQAVRLTRDHQITSRAGD